MDIRRYIHDRKMNSRTVSCLSRKKYEMMDLSFGAVQNEDIENFHVDVENRESINNVHRVRWSKLNGRTSELGIFCI